MRERYGSILDYWQLALALALVLALSPPKVEGKSTCTAIEVPSYLPGLAYPIFLVYLAYCTAVFWGGCAVADSPSSRITVSTLPFQFQFPFQFLFQFHSRLVTPSVVCAKQPEPAYILISDTLNTTPSQLLPTLQITQPTAHRPRLQASTCSPSPTPSRSPDPSQLP